jgi:hypothetical protein
MHERARNMNTTDERILVQELADVLMTCLGAVS